MVRARKRRDVEHLLVFDVRRGDFRFGTLAHDVELALEGVFVHARRDSRQKSAGCRAARRAPRGRWRRRPPACHASREPSVLLRGQCAPGFLRTAGADASPPAETSCRRRTRRASGSSKPSVAHSRAKNLCGNLNQNAGAVAGLRIAAAGAAVRQVDQDLDALRMMSWLFCPRMLATKPMPQASCSCAGSYSPWAGGRPCALEGRVEGRAVHGFEGKAVSRDSYFAQRQVAIFLGTAWVP